jgi:hypothetical protein
MDAGAGALSPALLLLLRRISADQDIGQFRNAWRSGSQPENARGSFDSSVAGV